MNSIIATGSVNLLGLIDVFTNIVSDLRTLLIAIVIVAAICFALHKWLRTQSAAAAIGTALGGALLAAIVWMMPGFAQTSVNEFKKQGVQNVNSGSNDDSFSDLFEKSETDSAPEENNG